MEEGIANIFMITTHKTLLKCKITKNVSKKTSKGFDNKHTKTKNRFFDEIIAKLETQFKGQDSYSKVSCVVVGSPGFTRQNFSEHIKEVAEK